MLASILTVSGRLVVLDLVNILWQTSQVKCYFTKELENHINKVSMSFLNLV